MKKKAFIAYARADKDMVHRFLPHIKGLEHAGKLKAWYDAEIVAGEKWKAQIIAKLNSSDIVILCLSGKSLGSKIVQNVEMPAAWARQNAGKCIIIPIHLTPCNWQVHEKISELQVIPRSGKAVSEYNDEEEAWKEVTEEIVKAIESMPRHTEPSPSATPRDAQPSRPPQTQIDHDADKSSEHATVSVHSAGAGLAGVDILALFPNHTWKSATTDAQGQAHLLLHSNHLPMTVFAAASDCAACIEYDWVPAEQDLALEMSPLPGGGSVIFPKGTGTLPGLEGQLEPIRDSIRDSHGQTHDRTYLYALTNAINGGQKQPVYFLLGEELHLADADGNERWVRVVYIAGCSALVEYRARPSSAAEK